jgi:hypothetical protein
MTRSTIRTLLSKITGFRGRRRTGTHTDYTSAATHSWTSLPATSVNHKSHVYTSATTHSWTSSETLVPSLPATSVIHKSHVGYDIPPYPGTDCFDEAALSYQLRHLKGDAMRLDPLADTFGLNGLIQTLHPGCFKSVVGTEKWWRDMLDGLPEITDRSRVCWYETPLRRDGDGPSKLYTATLGRLSVMDSRGVESEAVFEFEDGCPAEAWTRLQESITLRDEIGRTADKASKARKWYRRRRR